MQAGCVFTLVFGIYLAEYNAIIMHVQLKEQFQKMDYRLYVTKGVAVTLGTTTPLHMGVTPETMHTLLADSTIQMQFYGNQNTHNANIVYESLDDFPEQVRDTIYWESYGRSDDFMLQYLRNAGYQPQEDIAFYPIIGIDRSWQSGFCPANPKRPATANLGKWISTNLSEVRRSSSWAMILTSGHTFPFLSPLSSRPLS